MNLYAQFELLGRKQLILQEGIDMLKQTQLDFKKNKESANSWGFISVMSNVVLVPLNCIVNAFELGSANTIYQIAVKSLYDKFARSGTRVESGLVKESVSLLKKAAIETLKKQGLTTYIPGVNILAGFAEDSIAAWQVINTVEKGNRELDNMSVQIERNIAKSIDYLTEIGIQRNEILEKMDKVNRTT